ncbi:MAG: PAS domain S-box protein [Arthrospira sp. PLM2.Bin9]|nr:PAS domain S-box protein [Arthrospira sp. PLM2.Bin9]TVU55125.1 MAG: PAS domain S-box protein [Arthrospira sp. PLM2.Bin9]
MQPEAISAIIRDPLVVSGDLTVMEAIAFMSGAWLQCQMTDNMSISESEGDLEARSTCVIVLQDLMVVGILTQRDIVGLAAQQQNLGQLLIEEVMTPSVITLRESELTDSLTIINLLQKHRIRHLPIVDDSDRLVGLVTHQSLRKLMRPIDLLRLRLVSEVMTRNVVSANCDQTMLEIARLMSERRVSCVVIVETQGDADHAMQIPLGILTERDLLQFQSLGLNWENIRAENMMSSPLFTIRPEENLWEVQQLMEQRRIGRGIVTGERGELLGIVTQTSLLQCFNPLELYKLAEVLEEKVSRLESEKFKLLQNRAAELESQVKQRTAELRKRAEGEKLISELATKIRSSLDLQTILDTTVEEVRQVLKCDRVNIWRFGDDWETVVVAESTNSPVSLIGERIADTCFKQSQAEIYRQGKIRVVSDIYTTEMTDCHREMLIRLHTRAKIILPLLCGEQLWGLLNVTESEHPRQWKAEEIELLRALSVQLAIGLQQATNHQQLQIELQEKTRIEAELRTTETKLRKAQKIAGLGTWQLDHKTQRLLWSDEVFAFFEIEPENFSYTHDEFLSFVHPEDRDLVNDMYNQHLCDRQSYSISYRILLNDGRIKYAQEYCDTLYDENNQPICSDGTIQDITLQNKLEQEHIRAEDMRKQAESISREVKLLDNILDIILAGYWDWDISGNTEYLSPGFKRMFGYEDHELPNSPESWQNLLFPEDLPRVLDCFEKHIKSRGKIPYYNEVRYRHKNGSTVWVVCSGQVIEWDDDGNAMRMVGCHIDISDRKKSEIALQESEARYRRIIETTLEGVWIIDEDAKTTFVNQRMADMLGYTPSEMIGMGLMDFLNFPEQLQTQNYLERRKQGIQEQHTCKFQRRDGTALWAIISTTPMLDDQGNFLGAIGLLTDISELVNIQEALKTSEMQLSGILNSSLDGIMAFRSVRDDRGQIIDFEWLLVNPSAGKIVGKSADDLIGQRLLEQLPGHQKSGLFEQYVEVVQSGQSSKKEFYYNQDGIDCWFENISVKLGDGFAVTFRDITAIKQSEQALSLANEQLTNRINELDQRHTEMLILSEMSDFMQAALTVQEACEAISYLLEPLFPECAGGIFLMVASRDSLEMIASWGKECTSVSNFVPKDCWALRRGRVHLCNHEKGGISCRHIQVSSTLSCTLCIPMMAQGETLGLLYLSTESAIALSEAKQQAASTVAEQIAMAIANLNLRETLQHQSIRDPLTGLFNRRYLEEYLNQEIARAKRQQHAVGVIMIDVDNFKHFNDIYGHDAGDFVLQKVGEVLKSMVRESDVACRYGGEEMTLILPSSSLENTSMRAEQIREAIAALVLSHNHQHLGSITASLGVAAFPKHGSLGIDVIQAADVALYRAKNEGRNRVVTIP